mmetsp:Transcript_29310/g.33731  ORF Transcript_29310/g.33731 Transcript_29310/m.33731 type:complete len:404 (-) Transcript_29310:20-1231(-)
MITRTRSIVKFLFQASLLGVWRITAKSASPIRAQHTNNHAIIVSTSRYYHNYRHVGNALSIYHHLKTFGNYPDSNIVLMLADEILCNARNPIRNELYTDDAKRENLCTSDIEVDYRGDDVTVDNFVRVLLGRHPPHTPSNRKLHLNAESNVIVYLTGHGGDNFLKFQDVEELMSNDVYGVFRQMHWLNRYSGMLAIVDTCQAHTLWDVLLESDTSDVPNLVAMGSSLKDQNSYGHHGDQTTVGVSVVDRFTYNFVELLNQAARRKRKLSLAKAVEECCPYRKLHSTAGIGSTKGGFKAEDVQVSEFFANKRHTTKIERPAVLLSNYAESDHIDSTRINVINQNRLIHQVLNLNGKITSSNTTDTTQDNVKQPPYEALDSEWKARCLLAILIGAVIFTTSLWKV